MRSKLRFTGHPFFDVGVATILAFAQKTHPEMISQADLEEIANFIEQSYVTPPLRSHLTMAFTSNAWFIQDTYNPEKPHLADTERAARRATRREWATRHLRQWENVPVSEVEGCVFTGEPALAVNLSGRLPESRAGRSQIPLLQGDDSINFFPFGSPGILISGLAMLALQFFPLGCAKCGVGLLAVHTENEGLLFQITRRFLQHNLKAIAEAQAAGEEKLPKSVHSPKTLLIETLLEVERDESTSHQAGTLASLTAYNFTNGKAPDLILYQLPLEVMDFLITAQQAPYQADWKQIANQGWQLAEPKKVKGEESSVANAQDTRRNALYEDLFDLPHTARRFIRTYFLRLPRRTPDEVHLRRDDPLANKQDLVSWPLVELFLRKVNRMDKERVADICALGDKLAAYVQNQGGRGKRFFHAFIAEQNPANFRVLLIKANIAQLEEGFSPLFDLETYIQVFRKGMM